MTANRHLACICRLAALLTLVASGWVCVPAARAQSSGPTVDECSAGVVDSTTGVEETVCLYGDQSGLTATAEVDDQGQGSMYYSAPQVGIEAYLYAAQSEIWDSGDNCCGNPSINVSDGVVPQLNVSYSLYSNYDEDTCDSWANCNWTYGNGGLSVSVEVTPGPPPAPGGVAALPGNGQVTVSWTGSSGATSYNIYMGTSSGGENSTPIATGVTSTAYTATGLTNGTTYYFTVAAVNANGVSGYSNEAFATPSVAPVVASVTASSGNAGLAVNISGHGFGMAEGQSRVRFNGVPAGVLSWSDSSITAVVPSNATTGPVVVTLGTGEPSNNNVTFTVSTTSCFVGQ